MIQEILNQAGFSHSLVLTFTLLKTDALGDQLGEHLQLSIDVRNRSASAERLPCNAALLEWLEGPAIPDLSILVGKYFSFTFFKDNKIF